MLSVANGFVPRDGALAFQRMSTDERVLAAAARLFSERGFHGVGVAEIGREAGVTGPAIYRHFAGKDEILFTLLERASRRLEQHARADAGMGPWARLDALVDAFVQLSVKERDLALVFHRERRFVVEPWRRRLRRPLDAHAARWRELLAACRPTLSADDARLLAVALDELLLSVAEWPAEVRGHDALGARLRALARTLVRAPSRE
jgi:AcrR family transcriptional regulator